MKKIKSNKYFNIAILILIIWLTGNVLVTFASNNWEASWNMANQKREVALKQVEALNMEITAIETNWCREKLSEHYDGKTNMKQADIDRCVVKTQSSFQ